MSQPTPALSDACLAAPRALAAALPSGPYAPDPDPKSSLTYTVWQVSYEHSYAPGKSVPALLGREMNRETAEFLAAWDRETCLALVDELLQLRGLKT